MSKAHLYARGAIRRLLRLPCEVCGDRRRCWLWHVEIMRCPTCGLDAHEDKNPEAFVRVLEAKIGPATTAWTWQDGVLVPMMTNSGGIAETWLSGVTGAKAHGV